MLRDCVTLRYSKEWLVVSCCPLTSYVQHVKVTFAEGATKARVWKYCIFRFHNFWYVNLCQVEEQTSFQSAVSCIPGKVGYPRRDRGHAFFLSCYSVFQSLLHSIEVHITWTSLFLDHRLVKIDLKIYCIVKLLLFYKNLVKNEKNSHTRELNHYPWLNVNCLIVFSTMWTWCWGQVEVKSRSRSHNQKRRTLRSSENSILISLTTPSFTIKWKLGCRSRKPKN